jgi:hypothetical protein
MSRQIYIFFYLENENHELGMGLFVCKRIVLGVKRVENGRSRVL